MLSEQCGDWDIAQLVEHLSYTQQVLGSIPSIPNPEKCNLRKFHLPLDRHRDRTTEGSTPSARFIHVDKLL